MITKLLLLLTMACVGLFFTACDSSSNPASSNIDIDNGGHIGGDDGSSTFGYAEIHEDSSDYIWDSNNVVQIAFNGDNITFTPAVDSSIAYADSTGITIYAAGNYTLSGTLSDGQVILDTDDEEVVRLILNGVSLSSSTSGPLFIKSAKKTIIVLADGTINSITDAAEYVYEDPDNDEPNAALFSKDDFTIFGSGSLTVNGNYNDGITGKDGLIIAGGTITVNAEDDGIRGKDYLVISDGTVSVQAGGDGLKSDNEEDAGFGYIYIQDGTLNISAYGDGVAAESAVFIETGDIEVTSGGGSGATIDEDHSAKGMKANFEIYVNSGTLNIDAADDGLHCDGHLTVNSGDITIASGDDAIHADFNVVIDGGNIDITESYEGIESGDGNITINDGDISVTSSDDGINVAAGGAGPPGDLPSDYYLHINGGYIVVSAEGDGIDVNDKIGMSDGVVLLHGPIANDDVAIDYDNTFKITGGTIVGVGGSRVAQTPSTLSTQYSMLLQTSSTFSPGSLIHIETSAGEEILTFAPEKQYQSLAFSSPDLAWGSSYNIYLGGSSTGTETDGLYEGGLYTPGTLYTSFTISSTVMMLVR